MATWIVSLSKPVIRLRHSPLLYKSIILKCSLLLGFILLHANVVAQSDQAEEVLLTFRYRGIGNVYVTGLYDYDIDRMFLPVSELFSLLQIYYEPSPGDFSLSGNFLTPDNPFSIYFANQQVVLDGTAYNFEFDDFRIGEMDYFASPRVFEEVFGMEFTVNMNTLTLSLESSHTMPVEEAAERQRARQLIEAREVTREYYPLEFDRNRRVMGIGFADYTISGSFSQDNPNMNYSLIGGAEVLGGDIQGSVIGSWSGEDHRVRTSNLRWRYVVRDKPWFSTFQAGQMSTTGLVNRSIRGASISNDPIEPRRIYESYIVDGNTEPDSEVELFLNNRLIDFRRADASGYYRFEFPLTYGTTKLTINIYTPSGEVRTIDRRVQIPFTFLPPGELAYNIQAGQTETFLGATDEESLIVHGDVAVGVTSWLTAKVGSEYIEDHNDNNPLIYGSLSARVFSQYLLNVDIAPDAFYRGIASVMYPSGRSFSLQYTSYEDNPMYSWGGADQDVQASLFIPFNLFNTQMGFRFSGDHRMMGDNSVTRYRTDLNMRIGRMNIRGNYRDVLYYTGDDYSMGQGIITGSLTYTFMRSPGIPVLVRGMFLRGNVSYNTFSNEVEDISLQLTRSIRQTARINLQAGYDLRSEQYHVRLGFIMDLSSMRATTNVDVRDDRTSVRQNIRGSLGFDRRPDRVVTSNRNQVGRAGASVILFVDNNNSGSYDEGDEIIAANAVRLDRSAQMQVGSDGIVRISQLQSYYRYNMQIIRQALPNPMLAPAKDQFSFVADPNQYKRIEIPFYRTGIIDGTVYIMRNGEQLPQGGLRLIISGTDNDFSETIRNFSDGSYYAMDMPPGMYTIEVDPTQLDFLDAYMPGGPKTFEIRAVSEGDFIEGLELIIEPKREEEVVEEVAPPVEETVTAEVYYVVVNDYPTIYVAETARKLAVKVSKADYHISYSEAGNLFRVQSAPADGAREAENLLEELTEEGFEEARILTRTFPDYVPLRFQVQLAAFSDRTTAQEQLMPMSEELGVELVVEEDDLTGRFSIRTTSYPSIPEIIGVLHQIREHPEHSGAFLLSKPRIPAVPVIHTSGF